MKNKIIALILIGFLGLYLAPTLLANSQGDAHRVYPEFRPTPATDIEIVKKISLPGKGKPTDKPGKPPKPSQPAAATGILGDPVAGHRYAIIIGISDYPGTANDLQYADDDALAMKNVLMAKYGFAEGNIALFLDMNATASNIAGAINALKGIATADDEVIFFYSGHGGKGIADDGDNEKIDESIISHDGINLVHIWDGDLKNLFKDFLTNRIVFIFDSCVSGGMTDLSVDGRVINMATEEKRFDTAVERYYEGYGGAGELTYYFVIKGMDEGLADVFGTEGEGVVTVEEAFDYAKASVNYDHPTLSDKFENDLLL